MTNVGSVVYVPPKGRLNSDAFLANVSAFKATHPVYFYSDQPGRGIDNTIANPELVRNPRRPWAINNCCWLFGLKLAMDAGLEFFCYLESDCRVNGDNWDGVMWDDFQSRNPSALVYGTPVIHNCTSGGPKLLHRSIEFAYHYQTHTGWPMAIHGGCPGLPMGYMMYPNGAAAIYHTATVANFFPNFQNDIGRTALSIQPWDCVIGLGMHQKFGDNVLDHFAFASRSFSGYGDTILNAAERKALLTSGKCSVIHQWKQAEL